MNRIKSLDKINGINIYQWEKGYKVTIDSLIISGFVNSNKEKQKLLDIGTGIGIIPILLKKRFPKWQFDGVEIQNDLFKLAKKNYNINKITGTIFNKDVNNLNFYNYYDVVISNPPFFNNGIISLNKEIAKSKHEICLNLKELIIKSDKFLKTKGYFYCIYPSSRLIDLIYELKESSITPFAIKFIQSFEKEEAHLVLIAARKNVKTKLKCLKPLIIYKNFNIYSEETKLLYELGKIIW